MKQDNFFHNLLTIMFSNGVLLISQVLVGLVLPKLLSLNSFGNYRIFILYCSYAALLHFGFVDGILVKYGGIGEKKINKKQLSQFFSFFLFLELFFSVLIILIAIFFTSGKYRIIFMGVGIYTFVFNLVTAFQFLSQALMNFGLVARINNILSFLNIFNIIVPFFLLNIAHLIKKFPYYEYIILYLISYFLILFVYIRYFIKKRHFIYFTTKLKTKSILNVFKVGLPITIASQIANIALNLDNQFVSMFFSTESFAKYSFAYNLISLTISIVLAISTVLFPYLNRQGKTEIISNYTRNMSFMLLFIYLTLLSYYPIKIITSFILPEYIGSLKYFRILLPGVAITTSITTIVLNHYKVTGDMRDYLKNGIISLILSLALYLLIYYLFHNIYMLAYASLIVLFIWFFLEDYIFRKKYKIVRYNEYYYIISVTLFFQFATYRLNDIVSIILYIVGYFALSYLFERQYLKEAINFIKGRVDNIYVRR